MLLVFLASAETAGFMEILKQLSNYGGIAVVLAWLLWKSEPRLRAIEAAIDRLVRLLAIFMIELPHVIEAVKTQCRDIIKETDKAAKERGDEPEK